MPISKPAETDYPVHDFIRERWSPRAFLADKPVPRETLCALLEGARWAASSNNLQPWAYILATRDQPEDYETLLGCLTERNQAWAFTAPVLMIGCARTDINKDGVANRAAQHDLGAASALLTLQAWMHGLHVHQMVGIQIEKVRETYDVPDDVAPMTGVALGYQADADVLPDKFNLHEREVAPRERKKITEFVFTGKYGTTSKLVG